MTNDLRQTIVDALEQIGFTKIYYSVADAAALYPHAVYELRSVGQLSDDLNRYDYILIIDVWDRDTTETRVLDLCDAVISGLNAANMPQANILPTFYLDGVTHVPDDDKRIKHEQVKFTVQVYERG